MHGLSYNVSKPFLDDENDINIMDASYMREYEEALISGELNKQGIIFIFNDNKFSEPA